MGTNAHHVHVLGPDTVQAEAELIPLDTLGRRLRHNGVARQARPHRWHARRLSNRRRARCDRRSRKRRHQRRARPREEGHGFGGHVHEHVLCESIIGVKGREAAIEHVQRISVRVHCQAEKRRCNCTNVGTWNCS